MMEDLQNAGTSIQAPIPFSVRFRRVFFGANPKNTLIRVLIIGSLCILFSRVCWMPIKVSGWSMFPTYQDGSVTFINRLSYLNQPPARGDVVAVKTRRNQGLLLKRIVGLPGESLAIRKGTILINGSPLKEEYIDSRIPWKVENPVLLGADQFFIIGDNRAISVFGTIERDQILGKVIF